MRYLLATAFVMLTLGTAHSVHAASNWPTSSGTLISSTLTSTLPPSGRAFEPSDAAFVNGQLVLVSDEGDIASMNADGSSLSEWKFSTGADLEGIAVNGDTAYLLHERNRDVYAVSLSTHAAIATYDLSPWIAGDDNLGPEALAYVDGLLYVGHQVTGTIYKFDLTSGTPVLRGTIETGIGLSAMSKAGDDKLYAMGSGMLRAYAADMTYTEYRLPSGLNKPEGVALSVDCAAGTASLFIADDSGPVYRYDRFPVSCPVVVVPTPEPTPEPAPEPTPILFSSIAGNTNGRITVSYSDGSTATYAVFDMRTTRLTSGYQYKNSRYLVVTGPYGGRIAVVDAYTGTTIAMRSTPTRASILSSYLLSVIGY